MAWKSTAVSTSTVPWTSLATWVWVRISVARALSVAGGISGMVPSHWQTAFLQSGSYQLNQPISSGTYLELFDPTGYGAFYVPRTGVYALFANVGFNVDAVNGASSGPSASVTTARSSSARLEDRLLHSSTLSWSPGICRAPALRRSDRTLVKAIWYWGSFTGRLPVGYLINLQFGRTTSAAQRHALLALRPAQILWLFANTNSKTSILKTAAAGAGRAMFKSVHPTAPCPRAQRRGEPEADRASTCPRRLS